MALNLTNLTRYAATYPAILPRTSSLEHRIKIGTGYHGKWYRSQREHMLGWFVFQICRARMAGDDPLELLASAMWNRLKCSPSMFWLAEAAGVSSELLDKAEDAAIRAAKINPKDGDPHGKFMREILPWPIVEEAILSGSKASWEDFAKEQANNAFDRLAEKRSQYRKYIPWKL
ncbi:MAG: hypothetical protein GY761_20625 [Hyphomicrobiales bacterium]|nr:hypothetical protein [Hyphomicrobiales bacterium]